MYALLIGSNDHEIDTVYAKCHSQIAKLRSFIEQKRSDRTNNDAELLRTISNESPSLQSRQIPNLQCTAKMSSHFGKIYALHWFPDGTKIVSASQDGKLIVSEANSFLARQLFNIQLNSAWVMMCSVSPSGTHIASGGLDNVVTVFDVSDMLQSGPKIYAAENIQKKDIVEHEGYISAAQFIDNNRIISVSGDCTARIYDLHQQKCLKVFSYPADIECVDINPQKSIFLTGCIDAAVYLDDYRIKSSSQHVGKYAGHQTDVNSVRWFPDNMSFVSGSDDSTVRLFDMRSFEQMNVYEDNNILCSVTSVDCSQSGYYVFAAYDDDPYCVAWNSLTGRREQELQHPHRVSCLQMSPNGMTLATGCWDRQIRIWSNSTPPSLFSDCFDKMSTCDKCICFCAICLLSCFNCSCCKR